jgi:hypothetical protein
LPAYLATHCQQFGITFFQASTAGFGKRFGRAADFQHAVLGGSWVVDDFKRLVGAALRNALQATSHDAQRIGQQGTVRGIVDIGFDRRRVDPQLAATGQLVFLGLLNHPLMDLLSPFGAKQSKARKISLAGHVRVSQAAGAIFTALDAL